MKLPRRNFLRLASGAAALPTLSRIAQAQTYPSRPITLIIPWQPGGVPDTEYRVLADIASKELGQPIIVENKPGGVGSLGPASMAVTSSGRPAASASPSAGALNAVDALSASGVTTPSH